MSQYSRDKLFDFIKHDALVSLHNNPLLREKQPEIAQTYEYLFGFNIKEAKLVAPLLVVNQEKSQSIFTEVAYDVVQSFGLDFFTNADLKDKSSAGVLIHSIKLDHEGAIEKIKHLDSLRDVPVFLNFYNLDTASQPTINQLKSFLSNKGDNIFMGVESQADVKGLQELQTVEMITPRPKLK